jgi:hypothetical protein
MLTVTEVTKAEFAALFVTVPEIVCAESPGYMSSIVLVWTTLRSEAPADVVASPDPVPVAVQYAKATPTPSSAAVPPATTAILLEVRIAAPPLPVSDVMDPPAHTMAVFVIIKEEEN